MIDLSREGAVFVLRFDAPENRFRPDNIEAWDAALDEVEGAGSPASLVTTGTGKFYSNGLDLEWMFAQTDPEVRDGYIPKVLGLMARVLTFPTIKYQLNAGNTNSQTNKPNPVQFYYPWTWGIRLYKFK